MWVDESVGGLVGFGGGKWYNKLHAEQNRTEIENKSKIKLKKKNIVQ
jgi:hypothetical protein